MKIPSMTVVALSVLTAACTPAGTTDEKTPGNQIGAVLDIAYNAFNEESQGAHTVNLEFRLNRQATSDVTAHYIVTPIDAQPGEDYELESGSITIPAGIRTLAVPMTIIGDTIEESDENIRIVIDSVQGAVAGKAQYVVTIKDDDEPPELSLSISNLVETDQSITHPIKANLSYPVNAPVKFSLELIPQTASENDVALEQTDFEIPPGQKTVEFDVLRVFGDLTYEGTESFAIKIKDLQSATVSSNQVSYQLLDNDSIPKVSFNKVSDTASENAGTVTVSVGLDRPSSMDSSVAFHIDGTATPNTDYQLITPSTLEFPAGQVQGQISIKVIADSIREGGETVRLQLSNPQGIATGEDSTYTLIISPQISLNDTGSIYYSDTQDFQKSSSISNYPGQDAAFGLDTIKDNEQLIVNGQPNPRYTGAAGFDFTKLDESGNPLSASAPEWACVRDNRTGLVFEAKQAYEDFWAKEEGSEEMVLSRGWYRSAQFTYSWNDPRTDRNGGYAGWVLGKNGAPLPNSAPTLPSYCGYKEDMVGRSHRLFCSTKSYTDEMNFRGHCGYKDWRVPEVNELRSIINYAQQTPLLEEHVLDIGFFECSETGDCVNPDPSNPYYWTATPVSSNPDSAWCLNIESGEIKLCHKSDPHRVIAVRADSTN